MIISTGIRNIEIYASQCIASSVGLKQRRKHWFDSGRDMIEVGIDADVQPETDAGVLPIIFL